MGFLSKLMKNPIVQMLAPMAISMAGPGIFAALGTKMPWAASMFGNMNPMAANALKQGLIGYGTGLATGAEKPGKQAAYAGLASILPSYMSASREATDFNKRYALSGPGKARIMTQAPEFDPMDIYLGQESFKPTFTGRYSDIPAPKAVTPWDILSTKGGVTRDIPSYLDKSSMSYGDPSDMDNLIPGLTDPFSKTMDADIFTKTTGGGYASDRWGNLIPIAEETKSDLFPTAFSQGTAAVAEYLETADERADDKWKVILSRRKKEYAWLMGVPEHMITGEMVNPWDTGPMFNTGGIASLQNGGDVNGPGTGTSDSIDAKLSDGEFVMTAKAVENLGGGDRYEGARQMYGMMNMLDPESETIEEVV